ncbi:MAG: PEGA domain-containing protein [Candidatus Acidiferrales bacterium]
MKNALIFVISALTLAVPMKAQQDKLQEVSPQYPIKAHIVAVEMHTGTTTTGNSGGDYDLWGSNMHVPDTRRNVSYEWHLMKTVVGDKMYGLSVSAGRHNAWLGIGDYALKRVKNGFEVQYRDETGKVRQEVLTIRSEEPPPAEAVQAVTETKASDSAEIAITSTPAGADIELDGAFVGSTPSTIDVTVGDHAITIKKSGFAPWERKIKVNGGQIQLSADLQASDGTQPTH